MANKQKDKPTDCRLAHHPGPSGIPLGPTKQVEVTLPKDLTVVLSQTAFSQLFGYAGATELEVSLLSIVERDGSTFTAREFFLVPQRGRHSHTETDPAAIGELIERLMLDGRSEDARKIRCWAYRGRVPEGEPDAWGG